MPKGHLEAGETPEQAALREVKEETNLTARIIQKIGETAYSFRRKDGRGVIHKRVHWFLMDLAGGGGELRPFVDEGIVEASWLSFEEAREHLTFPGDREMLRLGFGLRQATLQG